MKNTTKKEPTTREIQEVANMIILQDNIKDYISALEEVGHMGSSIKNSVRDWQNKFIAKGNYNKEAIFTAMENVIHDFRQYEEAFNQIKDMVDTGPFEDFEELN